MLGKNKAFEQMRLLVDESKKFAQMPIHHESSWQLDRLVEYAEGLFDRAPFKVGDRVRLTRTPVIDKDHSWGWISCKHWMVEGAEGIVTEVDFHKGKFEAYVQFDNESWLNYNDTVETPTVPKRNYLMKEDFIARVENKE